MKAISKQIKEHSLNNLFQCLDHVTTSNNLLILDKGLSGVINDLTPFSRIKKAAKIEKILWMDDFNDGTRIDYQNTIREFSGVIIVVRDQLYLSNLEKLICLIDLKSTYVVVENLSKSFLYKFNQFKLNQTIELTLENVRNYTASQIAVEISSLITVLNWNLLPIVVDDSTLSIEMSDGIDSYFKNPIKVTSKLSDAIVKIISLNPTRLENIYGLGDHSSLLIKITQDKKNDFENSLNNFERLEIGKIGKACDLIVLERNLDYISPLFNQLNYSGLINDLFGIKFKQVEIPVETATQEVQNLSIKKTEKHKLDDDLYQDLKHLNFASIGLTLNKLAKFLQQEYETRHNAQSINEIKSFVDKLGGLTSKQELIKKHTLISESILNFINNENSETSSFTKNFLELQNDILELDYRAALEEVLKFINQEAPLSIILRFVCLLSLIFNGLKIKDFNLIKTEIISTYGIKNLNLVNNLLDYGIIRIKQQTSQFSFSASSSQPAVVSENHKLGVSASPSALQDYQQLVKFFNLQPVEDENDNFIEINDLKNYKDQSFTLPGGLVPILTRLVESLYSRAFLVKPINNLSRRPNWKDLGLDVYFKGEQVDLSLKPTKKRGKVAESKTSELKEELILVTVIGGLTYGEMSSFKFLELKLNLKYNPMGINKRFILLTNEILKSDSLVETCRENI